MNVCSTKESLAEIAANAIVIGVNESCQLIGAAAEFDQASAGQLMRLIETKDIKGKNCEITSLLAPQGVKAAEVVVVGLGKESELGRGEAFRAAASAAKQLASNDRKRVAYFLGDGWPDENQAAAVCGAVVGCEGQDIYREEKNLHPFEELIWNGISDGQIEAGRKLADGVNLTRRLVNEPPSTMCPVAFAEAAERMAKKSGLGIEVWDEKKLADERCGALLGVARGSSQPPRLVILRHNGAGDGAPALALVGKGRDVRLWRSFAETERFDEDDEMRYGRSRHGRRRDAGDRSACVAGECNRSGWTGRKHGQRRFV